MHAETRVPYSVRYLRTSQGGSMDQPATPLGEDRKDEVKAYLDWLLDAINKYASQIRRTTALALFLMAAFIIVSQSGGKISAAGFSVSKGSLVFIFIPAVVACLFLQLVTDTNQLIALYNKFHTEFELWTDQSQLQDSRSLVLPPFPLVWGASMIAEKSYPNLHAKIQRVLVASIDKITPFIGLIFLILAYAGPLNPSRNGLPVYAVISISFSILISCVCVIFAVSAYLQPPDP